MSHCDESGFSLIPLTPYAWQKGRRELTVAKEAGKRLNVIGFWSRQGHFLSVEQTQNVDLDTIMEVLEALSGTLTLPTVLVLENAPWHTSKRLVKRAAAWERKGLFLYFLPAYSPELNRIELLWKKVKHEWLPLKAWKDWKTFRHELQLVLDGIGSTIHTNLCIGAYV